MLTVGWFRDDILQKPVSSTYALLCREGGDIYLIITLVPKVSIQFLICWLNNFGDFKNSMVGSLS